MVATASRIGFITSEFRSVAVTNATAATEFGDDARDTKDEPFETFFNSMTDVETMANERIALIGVKRRRFRTEVAEILPLTGTLDYSQTTPTVKIVDSEKSADLACAAVEFGLDFAKNITTVVGWG